MRMLSAIFLLSGAALLAQQSAPPSPDPLVEQRRLAALLRQATTAYEKDDFQGAIKLLGSAAGDSADNLSVLNLRAAAMTRLGQHEEAGKIFSEILQADPNYFPAAFNMAEVKFLSGDREGALEAFRQLRRRDPRNELLRFKIYLCLVSLGRQDEAAVTLGAMSPAGLTPSWYYAQAVAARREGNEAKAREYLHAARALHGEKGCALYDEALELVGMR